ncbi:uncharacterized protein Dvar_57150 [Desulfosarcina variabilis str. Montpellier]
MGDMEDHDPKKDVETRRARSKADFIRRVGMGPDLAKFLIDFTERPEILFSLSLDRYREFENQMDAIISSLEKQ